MASKHQSNGDGEVEIYKRANDTGKQGVVSRQTAFVTSIKEQPVTEQRKPYITQDGDQLRDPGTARANIAASRESPNGTTENDWAKTHQDQTVPPSLPKQSPSNSI